MATSAMESKPPKEPSQTGQMLRETIFKLNPWTMVHNPVMFVVELGTLVTFWFTLSAPARSLAPI